MKLKKIESPRALPAEGGYSQAVELTDFNRVLFVSGQIPVDVDGINPDDFNSQCELVWHNIKLQLEEANMKFSNIVKVTTFLSDRKYADENSNIRRNNLGDHKPALTVIITGIYDKSWLVEIEVIAAA